MQAYFKSKAMKRWFYTLVISMLVVPLANFSVPQAEAQVAPEQCTQPLDVVILIDLSNSMGECVDQSGAPQNVSISPGFPGTYRDACLLAGMIWNESMLDEAKSLAQSFVSNMQADDRISLVTFDNYSAVVNPLAIADTSYKAVVDSSISTLHSGNGGTNLSDGLYSAIAELDQNPRTSNKKILVFSDGEPTLPSDPSNENNGNDESLVVSAYGNAAGKDYHIYTFGLSGDVYTSLLQAMSSATGGTYYPPVASDNDMANIYNSNKIIDCPDPGLVRVCKHDPTGALLDGWEMTLESSGDGWSYVDSGYTGDLAYQYRPGCVDFSDLTPGSYRISETMQSGWEKLSPTGDYIEFDVTAGFDNTGNPFEFVNQPEQTGPDTGTLTICKVEDLTGNGSNPEDLPYLGGWNMSVTNDSLDFSQDVTTDDQKGCVTLNDLQTGSYTVKEQSIADWNATDLVVDTNGRYDPIGSGNDQVLVEIVADDHVTVTFYNYYEPERPNICGVKYFDHDQDTKQGQSDENLSGWGITLQSKLQCEEGEEWADEVVSFDQGPDVAFERSDTTKALGIAEDNDTMNFVSLGIGGELVLKFTNLIENGSGDDIQVFETTYNDRNCDQYPEFVHVYASQYGSEWTDLGTALCQAYDPTFDLGSLPWAQYIKLVDETNPDDFGGSADGFDVDGVRALSCLSLSENIRTETTDKNGYCFDPVKFGKYMVCEKLQDGWVNTTPLCQQVEVTENNMHPIVNFGNYSKEPTGNIQVCKYYDNDNDGEYDEGGVITRGPVQESSDVLLGGGDTPLANWIMTLTDGEQSYEGETDEEGCYTFEVPYGEYTVTEEPPAEESEYHWVQTYPGGDESQTVVIDSENQKTSAYFLNVKADLWGCKYNDASEETLPDWQIDLYAGIYPDRSESIKSLDMSWELVESTYTNNDETSPHYGCYYFTNVRNGDYRLEEVLQSGWDRVSPIDPPYYEFYFGDGEQNPYNFYNREVTTTGGGGPTGGCVSGCDGGSTPSDNPTPIVQGFELSPPTLEKSVDKEFANPGDILTYNVKVINSGTLEMTGVEVTDTLPDGMVFQDTGLQTKTWVIGLFPPGEQNFSYTVVVADTAAAGVYANTATLISNEFDPLIVEAPVDVVQVKVAGYEALPETGGPSSWHYVLGSLMSLLGLVFMKRSVFDV